MGPVDEDHAARSEQDVVRPDVAVKERVTGDGGGPVRLELGQAAQVPAGPRIEPPRFVPGRESGPTPEERTEVDGGRLDGGRRGRGQLAVQGGQGGHHRVELCGVPGIRRRPTVDGLEREGDPDTVVVDVEQPRERVGPRQRGRDHRLAAVDVRRVGIQVRADRLDEHGAPRPLQERGRTG